jgi:hypothetical protein
MVLPYLRAAGVLLVMGSECWGQAIVWQQGHHIRQVRGSWDCHSLFIIGGVLRQNLVGFGDEVKQEGGVLNSFSKVLELVRKEAAELCPEGKDKHADAQIVGDDVAVVEDVPEHQRVMCELKRLGSSRMAQASAIPTGCMMVGR